MGCTASSSKVVALDPSVAPAPKPVAAIKVNSDPIKVQKTESAANEVPLLKKEEPATSSVPKLDLRSPRDTHVPFEPLPDIPMKTGRTNKVVAFEINDEDRIKLRAPPRRLQQLQPLPKITQEQLNEKQRIADEKRTRALESKRMKSARTSRRRKNLRAALEAAQPDEDAADCDKAANEGEKDKDRLNVSLVRTDLADMQLRTALEDENDRGVSLGYEDEQVYKRQRQHENQTSPRDSLREQQKADRKASAESRRSTESGIGSAAHSAGSSRKVPMEVSQPFYSKLDSNIKLNLND